MNKITIEATITKLIPNQDALQIQCQDNMFKDKITKYTTRLTSTELAKWGNILKEGNIITYQGNIAETKQSSCGAYIVIYNPKIESVYRLVPERIELEVCDKESKGENEK